MLNKKNVPGLDGFIWWTGIVESRQDPLKLGRLQARIFLWDNDNKQLVPTDNLMWAQPIFATNSANDTCTLKEGDAVFGFYMDSDSAQYPFFFGRFPDIPEVLYPQDKGFSDPGTTLSNRPIEIQTRQMTGTGVVYTNRQPERYPASYRLNQPTTSRLARNENISDTAIPFVNGNMITGMLVGQEPQLTYNAKYPYNNSKESESGHYIDVDDTKGAERVFSMHRTGTFDEVSSNGSRHQKNCRDYWHVVHGIRKEYTVNDYDLEVGKDWNILVHQDENLEVLQNYNINVLETYNKLIGLTSSETVGTIFSVLAGVEIILAAPIIKLETDEIFIGPFAFVPY